MAALKKKTKKGRHSGLVREGSACRSTVPDPKNPLVGGGDIHFLLDLLYTWLGGGERILDLRDVALRSSMR